MWDKVIAEDFYPQFDHKNLSPGDTPMRYRRKVLEPGGSMSANDLVKNFLGRPQNMTAFNTGWPRSLNPLRLRAGRSKLAGLRALLQFAKSHT